MKPVLFVIFILSFGFNEAQTKSDFIGTWDVVSLSDDGITHLKKSSRYDKNKHGHYFHFEKSGRFLSGFYAQNIRCGNDSRLWRKQNKSWQWNSSTNTITIVSQIRENNVNKQYEVLLLIEDKMILQNIYK